MWGVLSAGSKVASTEPSSAWDGGDNLRAWQVADALFSLDEQRLRLYLQQGWNPNWLLDSEGNTPLHTPVLVCGRYPTHNQAGVVKVARFLVAAGSDPSIKNKWGETPLIIARAPKYCGPDHPVVAFLQGRQLDAWRKVDALSLRADRLLSIDEAPPHQDRNLSVTDLRVCNRYAQRLSWVVGELP